MTTMPHCPMADLSALARRFGYRFDGSGFHVGLARITQPEGSGVMFVYTSDHATAKSLWEAAVGSVLHNGTCGRLSLSFAPRALGSVIRVIEELQRS